MDANLNIYRAPEDEIPEADKARFEGLAAAIKSKDTESLEKLRAEVTEHILGVEEKISALHR